MKVFTALRALTDGILSPRRVQRATMDSALSIFAVAVLLLTTAETTATFLEAADPQLAQESSTLIHAERWISQEGAVDLSSPGRQFTAVMGGALVKAIISLLVLTAVVLGLARFLTDRRYSTAMALACVSAAYGIEILRTVVETTLHLVFHTTRAGLHAGIFIDPASHPYLFTWMQRLDLFGIWFFLSFSIAMATWEGLHPRFGLVVGATTFIVVQATFGFLTILAWMVMGPM